MPANIITAYDLQDLEKPLIPSRSRLYHLEPIGIGTPFVESLASYIVRLANAHCVSTQTLVTQEILPLLEKHAQSGTRSEKTLTVNGMSSLAAEWVCALEQLTLNNNLRYLTMLTWSEVVDHQRVVRGYRTWCPVCYKEWAETTQIIYEPLIWSLRVVTVCPKHHQELLTRCPCCQQLIPLLSSRYQPAYCPKCGGYLGLASNINLLKEQQVADFKSDWQSWVTDALCELLAAASNLSAAPKKEMLTSSITKYMLQLASGSGWLLARKIGVDTGKMWDWQRGVHMPRFDALLKMCFVLDTSPLAFLTGDTGNSNVAFFQLGGVELLSEAQQPKPLHTSELRQALSDVLTSKEYPPPSLHEIAERLGYSTGILSWYFPELCSKIARQHKQPVESLGLEPALASILTSGEEPFPSLTDIGNRLGYSVSTLKRRCPELCRAIVMQRRKPVNIEEIGKAMEAILIENKTPPPTLEETAKLLGVSVSMLNKYYPRLCARIAALRRKPVKAEQLRQDLEQALASDEVPPPPLREVAKRLGYSTSTLRGYYPELCSAIAKKHRKPVDHEALRSMMEAILVSDEEPLPTLREIAKLAGYSIASLKRCYPELCKAIARRRKRSLAIDMPDDALSPTGGINASHEGINLSSTSRSPNPHDATKKNPGEPEESLDFQRQRQTLEAVLTGDRTSVQSVRKIAMNLGCPYSTLRRRFPELCYAIAKLPKNPLRIESLRQSLEAIIANSDTPLSLLEVTRRLGCAQTTLQKHFPELCLAIKERHRKPMQVEEVRKALEEVLADVENPKPTLSETAIRLGYTVSALRKYFPELCSAIVKLRRKSLETDVARQILEDELASDTEPPTPLNEIARHLGVYGSVLYDHFPELCYAIAARYKSYRKAKSIEKWERICDEVRKATRCIHARGDYPSLHRVEALLGNPGVMMMKAAREAWHETLKELGFER